MIDKTLVFTKRQKKKKKNTLDEIALLNDQTTMLKYRRIPKYLPYFSINAFSAI